MVAADIDPERRWASIAAQRTELRRVADMLAAVTATASTPDRSISATVNSRGLLVDLQIQTSAVRALGAAEIAATVVDLVARADDELRDTRNRVSAACVQSSGAVVVPETEA